MAYQIVADGEVGDRREPRNDETPGQMISGREFRESKTGSSGNYPLVGCSRKSSTCCDVGPNPASGTGGRGCEAQASHPTVRSG